MDKFCPDKLISTASFGGDKLLLLLLLVELVYWFLFSFDLLLDLFNDFVFWFSEFSFLFVFIVFDFKESSYNLDILLLQNFYFIKNLKNSYEKYLKRN